MKDPRSDARRPAARTSRAARNVPWCLVAVALALLVSSVYWQVGRHQFVNLDDDHYVVENPPVLRGLSPAGVSFAFTTRHAGYWHPLTWLSHMLDVELFGASPGWHHRMNVAYHLLGTELLFLVLWRMTGGLWPSAFVAALFGVHPLNVESVAWVAERKNVLSALFFFLTLAAYLRYVRRPGTGRYLLVGTLFALGLLCKPMLVTLPLVLLLLDGWPLGRLAPPAAPHAGSGPPFPAALPRLVREKVPLLALSAVSGAVTYLNASAVGAVPSIERIPLWPRISNALLSYAVYLGQAAWPRSLAMFYPHPATVHAGIPAWQVAGAVLLLCGISAIALRQARRRPCLAAGWLWYLVMLFPVIGLVQAGNQAHADRYAYLPLVGVFIAIAWGIPGFLSGRRFRRLALAVLAGLSLAALSAASFVQAGYWRDSITLFSRAAAVTDDNWFALNCLGMSRNRLGQYRQAIGDFQAALRIEPVFPEAWNNMGVSYGRLGSHQEAINCFREALRIRPEYADAWNGLGVAYGGLGRYEQAVACFREAVRIDPGHFLARTNLAAAYGKAGKPPLPGMK